MFNRIFGDFRFVINILVFGCCSLFNHPLIAVDNNGISLGQCSQLIQLNKERLQLKRSGDVEREPNDYSRFEREVHGHFKGWLVDVTTWEPEFFPNSVFETHDPANGSSLLWKLIEERAKVSFDDRNGKNSLPNGMDPIVTYFDLFGNSPSAIEKLDLLKFRYDLNIQGLNDSEKKSLKVLSENVTSFNQAVIDEAIEIALRDRRQKTRGLSKARLYAQAPNTLQSWLKANQLVVKLKNQLDERDATIRRQLKDLLRKQDDFESKKIGKLKLEETVVTQRGEMEKISRKIQSTVAQFDELVKQKASKFGVSRSVDGSWETLNQGAQDALRLYALTSAKTSVKLTSGGSAQAKFELMCLPETRLAENVLTGIHIDSEVVLAKGSKNRVSVKRPGFARLFVFRMDEPLALSSRAIVETKLDFGIAASNFFWTLGSGGEEAQSSLAVDRGSDIRWSIDKETLSRQLRQMGFPNYVGIANVAIRDSTPYPIIDAKFFVPSISQPILDTMPVEIDLLKLLESNSDTILKTIAFNGIQNFIQRLNDRIKTSKGELAAADFPFLETVARRHPELIVDSIELYNRERVGFWIATTLAQDGKTASSIAIELDCVPDSASSLAVVAIKAPESQLVSFVGNNREVDSVDKLHQGFGAAAEALDQLSNKLPKILKTQLRYTEKDLDSRSINELAESLTRDVRREFRTALFEEKSFIFGQSTQFSEPDAVGELKAIIRDSVASSLMTSRVEREFVRRSSTRKFEEGEDELIRSGLNSHLESLLNFVSEQVAAIPFPSPYKEKYSNKDTFKGLIREKVVDQLCLSSPVANADGKLSNCDGLLYAMGQIVSHTISRDIASEFAEEQVSETARLEQLTKKLAGISSQLNMCKSVFSTPEIRSQLKTRIEAALIAHFKEIEARVNNKFNANKILNDVQKALVPNSNIAIEIDPSWNEIQQSVIRLNLFCKPDAIRQKLDYELAQFGKRQLVSLEQNRDQFGAKADVLLSRIEMQDLSKAAKEIKKYSAELQALDDRVLGFRDGVDAASKLKITKNGSLAIDLTFRSLAAWQTEDQIRRFQVSLDRPGVFKDVVGRDVKQGLKKVSDAAKNSEQSLKQFLTTVLDGVDSEVEKEIQGLVNATRKSQRLLGEMRETLLEDVGINAKAKIRELVDVTKRYADSLKELPDSILKDMDSEVQNKMKKLIDVANESQQSLRELQDKVSKEFGIDHAKASVQKLVTAAKNSKAFLTELEKEIQTSYLNDIKDAVNKDVALGSLKTVSKALGLQDLEEDLQADFLSRKNELIRKLDEVVLPTKLFAEKVLATIDELDNKIDEFEELGKNKLAQVSKTIRDRINQQINGVGLASVVTELSDLENLAWTELVALDEKLAKDVSKQLREAKKEFQDSLPASIRDLGTPELESLLGNVNGLKIAIENEICQTLNVGLSVEKHELKIAIQGITNDIKVTTELLSKGLDSRELVEQLKQRSLSVIKESENEIKSALETEKARLIGEANKFKDEIKGNLKSYGKQLEERVKELLPEKFSLFGVTVVPNYEMNGPSLDVKLAFNRNERSLGSMVLNANYESNGKISFGLRDQELPFLKELLNDFLTTKLGVDELRISSKPYLNDQKLLVSIDMQPAGFPLPLSTDIEIEFDLPSKDRKKFSAKLGAVSTNASALVEMGLDALINKIIQDEEPLALGPVKILSGKHFEVAKSSEADPFAPFKKFGVQFFGEMEISGKFKVPFSVSLHSTKGVKVVVDESAIFAVAVSFLNDLLGDSMPLGMRLGSPPYSTDGGLHVFLVFKGEIPGLGLTVGGDLTLSADGIEFGDAIRVTIPGWYDVGYVSFGNMGVILDIQEKEIGITTSLAVAPGEGLNHVFRIDCVGTVSLTSPVKLEVTGEATLLTLLTFANSRITVVPENGSFEIESKASIADAIAFEGLSYVEILYPKSVAGREDKANIFSSSDIKVLGVEMQAIEVGMNWELALWAQAKLDLLIGKATADLEFKEGLSDPSLYFEASITKGIPDELSDINMFVSVSQDFVGADVNVTVLEIPMGIYLEFGNLRDLTPEEVLNRLLELVQLKVSTPAGLKFAPGPERKVSGDKTGDRVTTSKVEGDEKKRVEPPKPTIKLPDEIKPFTPGWKIVEYVVTERYGGIFGFGRKTRRVKRYKPETIGALRKLLGAGGDAISSVQTYQKSNENYILTVDNTKKVRIYAKPNPTPIWEGRINTDQTHFEFPIGLLFANHQFAFFKLKNGDGLPLVVAAKNGATIELKAESMTVQKGIADLSKITIPYDADATAFETISTVQFLNNDEKGERVRLLSRLAAMFQFAGRSFSGIKKISNKITLLELGEGRQILFVGKPNSGLVIEDLTPGDRSTLEHITSLKKVADTIERIDLTASSSLSPSAFLRAKTSGKWTRALIFESSPKKSAKLFVVSDSNVKPAVGSWNTFGSKKISPEDVCAILEDSTEVKVSDEIFLRLNKVDEQQRVYLGIFETGSNDNRKFAFGWTGKSTNNMHLSFLDRSEETEANSNVIRDADFDDIKRFWDTRDVLVPQGTKSLESVGNYFELLMSGKWKVRGWKANPYGPFKK